MEFAKYNWPMNFKTFSVLRYSYSTTNSPLVSSQSANAYLLMVGIYLSFYGNRTISLGFQNPKMCAPIPNH